jgi:MerR family transcriptional regulator, light-induced transcriptional regulator
MMDIAERIEIRRAILAESIVREFFELHPECFKEYDARGRRKILRDVDGHLQYLIAAVRDEAPQFFADYIAWARVTLHHAGVRDDLLTDCLRIMSKTVIEGLSPESSIPVAECLLAGISQMSASMVEPPSFLREDEPLSDVAAAYLGTALNGDRNASVALISRAVDRGADITDLYIHVFERVQHEVGRLWQIGKVTVADEHTVTATTRQVLSQLYPRIAGGFKHGHSLIATCVPGESHDIGARIIADFFELDGWDTVYLGADVPLASIVETVAAHRADLLAISVTIATNVHVVAELAGLVRERPESRYTKILAGGRPFNIVPGLWRKVGVDGTAPDASTAARVADRLMGVRC